MTKGPVWAIARANERDYITPEDVMEAKEAGSLKEDVWRDVLVAFESGAVEDPSCVAFVALKMEEP